MHRDVDHTGMNIPVFLCIKVRVDVNFTVLTTNVNFKKTRSVRGKLPPGHYK